MPGGSFLRKADIDLPDAVLRALPRGSVDEDRALLEAALGEPVRALRPTTQQGTFHRVYLVTLSRRPEPVVARVPRLAHPDLDAGLRTAHDVSELLVAQGIPCVRSLGLFGLGERSVQLCEVAPGRSLRDLDDDDAALAAQHTALAVLLRRVHAVHRKGYGPAGAHATWGGFLQTRLDAHLAACRDAGLMDRAEAQRAEAVLCEFPDAPSRLLHGDLSDANAFTGDDLGPRLIDWEDALCGDPVFDVASWATFQPERRWRGMFRAYHGGDDPPAPQRFWRYYLRVALAKTAHRLRFGYGDTPGRPPPSRRIQRGLAALRGGVLESDA